VTIIPDFGERYLQTALFEPFRYEGSDDVSRAERDHVRQPSRSPSKHT
jgi:hypothetical protein